MNLATLLLPALLNPNACPQAPGDIRWQLQTTDLSAGFRPRPAPDGSLYWNPGFTLYAISPSGQVTHSVTAGEHESNPVDLALDGTVYAGGATWIHAFSPTLELLWQFNHDALGGDQGLIGGPNVGPDGNIYAVADSPDGEPGAFSLDPAGNLRWTLAGFGSGGGSPGAEIVFGPPDHLYLAANLTPIISSGLFALDFDGNIQWVKDLYTGAGTPGNQPVVSPLNGNVHRTRAFEEALDTFAPDGEEPWSFFPGAPESIDQPPTVDNEGFVYVISNQRDVYKLSPHGDVQWESQDVADGAFTSRIRVSPDGETLIAGFGGFAPRVVALSTNDGSELWHTLLPLDDGQPVQPRNYAFSFDGSTVYVNGESLHHAFLFAIQLTDSAPPPADLDEDGSVGFSDLLILLSFWGPCQDCEADLDGDGNVGFGDLLFLLAHWTG